MHDTRKRRNRRHNNHPNHHHHHLGRPPDRRQGAQTAHAAHAMHRGGLAPPDAHSDSDEPPDGTAVHACNHQCGHSGDTAPPPTSTRGHAPPPPPHCQCNRSLGVAHKRATQMLQPAHTMTQEPSRRHTPTPTVEQCTSAVPCHIANGPKGPSVSLTRTTDTRCKRRLRPNTDTTVWRYAAHHHLHGAHAARLLTPASRENPHVVRKRATLKSWSDQAATHQGPRPRATTTATAIGWHQGHPPTPPSTGPQGPGAAHRHATAIAKRPHAAAHRRPPRRAATTTPAIGMHQHPHLPLSTGPKGPGVMHKRVTPIVRNCRRTTTIPYRSGTPPTSPTSSPCRAQHLRLKPGISETQTETQTRYF
jgi:hypothetical protein